MNAADPDRSARLKRVLGVLADRKEHSTLEIAREAQVCAVNSCIAELREAGHVINCRVAVVDGSRRWFYQLAPRAVPEQIDLIPVAA